MCILNLINEAFFNASPVKIAACGLASLWFRSAPSPSNIVRLRKNRLNTRQTGFLQATLLCGNLNQCAFRARPIIVDNIMNIANLSRKNHEISFFCGSSKSF